MSTFVGVIDSVGPRVFRIGDGRCRVLDPRLDVRRHSPAGFNWGYCGSGPAQLALAILCDVTGDVEAAQQLYQRYKFAVITGLPKEGFVLHSEEVEGWILQQIAVMQLHDAQTSIELGDAQ